MGFGFMYGVIDVGSNTVRLTIYKVERGKAILLLNKKKAVGLASYVKNGQMLPEGVNRVVEVLSEFKILLENMKITNVHTFATAALRNVKNSKSAVEEAIQRSGMDIEVISGELEAELDFIGATHAVDIKNGLLVDIGGGSTELVVIKDGKMMSNISFPMGSLNTYEQFVKNLLPNRAERKAIKQAVIAEIKKFPELADGSYETICGVGGSIRAANKLNQYLFQLPTDTSLIKAPNIKKMIKLLENDDKVTVPIETLDILLKIIPERVRTILPGMIILHTIIKYYKSKLIKVSQAGVRDGYVYKFLANKGKETVKEEAAPKKRRGRKPKAVKLAEEQAEAQQESVQAETPQAEIAKPEETQVTVEGRLDL